MSEHLLVVSVGPVQDFIAAERRTRDFWFGSWALSEISKAAALSLSRHGQLIFPAPNDPVRELAAGSTLNVANVILTICSEGEVPDELARLAKIAARERWKQLAAGALDAVREEGLINLERWRSQVDDVVEFYSAWVPFDQATDDYQKQRQRLMRLLAGRKNCRDFTRAEENDFGVPKSSLDGSRETILNRVSVSLKRRLRLKDGEQLDVIGLTKRLGGDAHACPSVSRIAADPWTRKAADECAQGVKTLLETADYLVKDGLARVSGGQFRAFPFEGAILYRNRLRELVSELQSEELEYLETDLQDLTGQIGEPDPYLAILAADGDKMGAAISSLKSPEDHRLFSRSLSHFADVAGSIVREHYGFLVYSGGDDVLALVPLDTALSCATQMHEQFGDILQRGCGHLLGGKIPTLSVGIAIGHFLDPLENLLEYARKAEKAAKGSERDGLSVSYHPRSGAPITVEGRWTKGIARRLELLTLLHRDDQIGDTAAFDLKELSRLYQNWPEGDRLRDTIQADAVRLLSRKKGLSELQQVEGLKNVFREISNGKDLQRLAEEIVIARLFAKSRALSGWNPPEKKQKGAA